MGLQHLAKSFSLNALQKPGVETAYTYLMAWFIMHYLILMGTVSHGNALILYVRRLHGCECKDDYIYYIRKTILNPHSYMVTICLTFIPRASAGDQLVDSRGKASYLGWALRPFFCWWLYVLIS